MNEPLSPETEAAIRASLSNKIHAIKLYREATGVGLKEAKDAVERMAAESRPSGELPGRLPTNAPAKGCFGLMVLGGVVLGAFAVRHLLA